MKSASKKYKLLRLVMFLSLAVMIFAMGGCARYARTVDMLYEPSATVLGGKGDVYIVIQESQQTQSPDIKRMLGTVLDSDNRKIDEVISSRSPAEIIQAAFRLEFKKAGYTVIPVTKRPDVVQRVIDLTKNEIRLDQTSELTNIKVTCQVLAGMDVYKSGQLIKRLQYEASASKADIRDRDLLAGNVLLETLRSLMQQAVPELHTLFAQ
ncbi:MAG: hypothetical protein HGB32_03135 [Geobacteraceae bacterium]|nr:hypothetical protein [Geobacteraceae bacterium]NTW79127.1 hypothetical protein [Geobacteraceae bacterium]